MRPPVRIRALRPIYAVCSPLLREPYIFCYSSCEFLAGRRSVFANHSISMTSLHCGQARTQKGRSAVKKLLNSLSLKGYHELDGKLCEKRREHACPMNTPAHLTKPPRSPSPTSYL